MKLELILDTQDFTKSYQKLKNEFDSTVIQAYMDHNKRNKLKCSENLKMCRNTMNKKIDYLKLDDEKF